MKRSLFADLDRLAGQDALLATNTSSLSINAIAAATAHPKTRSQGRRIALTTSRDSKARYASSASASG